MKYYIKDLIKGGSKQVDQNHFEGMERAWRSMEDNLGYLANHKHPNGDVYGKTLAVRIDKVEYSRYVILHCRDKGTSAKTVIPFKDWRDLKYARQMLDMRSGVQGLTSLQKHLVCELMIAFRSFPMPSELIAGESDISDEQMVEFKKQWEEEQKTGQLVVVNSTDEAVLTVLREILNDCATDSTTGIVNKIKELEK